MRVPDNKTVFECEDGERVPYHDIDDWAMAAIWENSGIGTYIRDVKSGKFYILNVHLVEIPQSAISAYLKANLKGNHPWVKGESNA